jgi:hypothetical protein
MKITTIFALISSSFFLNGPGVYAQSGAVSAGGVASGADGSVSYSIGQVNYSTASHVSGAVNQGLQQSFEIKDLSGAAEAIWIYPNPTAVGFVTLKIASGEPMNFSYSFFDLLGKHLLTEKVEIPESTISLAHLPAGTYLVKVFYNGKERKTFKIIKNQ